MRLFRNNRIPVPQPLPPGERAPDYARLITDNLAYMEKQCRRAVIRFSPAGMAGYDASTASRHGGGMLDNETDELMNELLDRLRADDFRALREFRGKAKLTTYITTIISNLVVDLARQKKGRSRARDRAREMGKVAELLHDLVYGRGCTLHEAHSHLEFTHGIREPLERLREMLERMQGRERGIALCADGESTWLVPGRRVVTEDAVEIVVVDPRRNAEASLMADQKRLRAREAVAGLIAQLDGEERFMLRMRFPADGGEEPKSARDIGQLLGMTEKSVDARIRRVLARFRETLLRQGLSLDDLIDP